MLITSRNTQFDVLWRPDPLFHADNAGVISWQDVCNHVQSHIVQYLPVASHYHDYDCHDYPRQQAECSESEAGLSFPADSTITFRSHTSCQWANGVGRLRLHLTCHYMYCWTAFFVRWLLFNLSWSSLQGLVHTVERHSYCVVPYSFLLVKVTELVLAKDAQLPVSSTRTIYWGRSERCGTFGWKSAPSFCLQELCVPGILMVLIAVQLVLFFTTVLSGYDTTKSFWFNLFHLHSHTRSLTAKWVKKTERISSSGFCL